MDGAAYYHGTSLHAAFEAAGAGAVLSPLERDVRWCLRQAGVGEGTHAALLRRAQIETFFLNTYRKSCDMIELQRMRTVSLTTDFLHAQSHAAKHQGSDIGSVPVVLGIDLPLQGRVIYVEKEVPCSRVVRLYLPAQFAVRDIGLVGLYAMWGANIAVRSLDEPPEEQPRTHPVGQGRASSYAAPSSYVGQRLQLSLRR